MELFGLIHRNNNICTISGWGLAITRGGAERATAIETAIRRVPLWDQLIKTIGKTPDREIFNKSIRANTINGDKIGIHTLDEVWYAYTEDISCISKSPPFSKWSSAIRKSNPRMLTSVQDHPAKHAPPKSEEIIMIPEPTVKTPMIEPAIQTAEQGKKVEIPEGKTPAPEPTSNYGVIRVQRTPV